MGRAYRFDDPVASLSSHPPQLAFRSPGVVGQV